MSDNLRHRYAELVTTWSEPGTRLARLAELLAVRDEELERLREENAYCLEALKGAENRRQAWRERAETDERRLARAENLRDKWLAWPEGDMHHAAGLMLAMYLDPRPAALDDQGPEHG